MNEGENRETKVAFLFSVKSREQMERLNPFLGSERSPTRTRACFILQKDSKGNIFAGVWKRPKQRNSSADRNKGFRER